ncbi:MAG: methylamine utilization protein MauG [Thalassospira sp.]|uniref:Methylamine utilization protein MauG n=2 Tax=Thalassospiraceae TaxID=2844866 RepID=A0ABR5Y6W2_9PROT|nr:methylamine utilization protein MauG [Thalassospira xiamenensis]MAL28055.1 methylamine utilization protein MauG [Thalassospira sp.]MBR9780762.1 methylamine utilization protein MauG [Rhodospirillales bacterium]QPL37177.1 methylamine utilization protein MauG [Thalassospira sp. B30-1]KZD09228.1 methylamine utilization protein MauG [Thalassospira xiamenensis]
MIIGRDHAATSEYRISNMPVLSRVSSMPLRGFLHLGCAFATTMLMIGAGGVGITSAKAQNGLGAPNSSATLLAELASNTSSFADKAALGEALYFDTNLSKNRTQACASCHEPTTGFRDPRSEIAHGAYSLGDDGASLGDRNAPMAAYAKFAPDFHFKEDGTPVGGQFWDGRAKDLAEQAGGPPLNPVEMGMPDKATVVARLQEDEDYVESFKSLFGDDVWSDTDRAYAAMTDAIAAFERTDQFAPFDSKYDRFLRGEYKMTQQEELGRVLFFSQQFTNCNVCHQLKSSPTAEGETFTNYEYHNIGVPRNVAVRLENAKDPDFTDNGLLDNPAIDDPAHKGKYKTPSLRNVAVTGPYMHNGVFSDLRTVIKFYNKYNSRAKSAQLNPETKQPWGDAEVPETISLKELEQGDALDTKRIDALVAFLKTLTDARYEPLLAEQEEVAAKAKKK